VLVTTPSLDAVEEASWFGEHLATRGIVPCAAVVNRCHPRFVSDETVLPEPAVAGDGSDPRLAAQLEVLRDAQRVALHDAVLVGDLLQRFSSIAVGRVELSAAPAREVAELARVARALGVAVT
jgi:hypothetical protein